MFGLEKNNHHPFEFELEKEIKSHPSKAHELLHLADEREQKIKRHLREGTSNAEDFDELGTMLHGFSALKRVINRIIKKKQG